MMKSATTSPKERDLAMLVDHQPKSFFRHRPSLLILAISILVTTLTFMKMLELEHVRLQHDFEQHSKNIVLALKDSIKNNLEILNEFGGFYSASENVTRNEFGLFSSYVFYKRSDIYMLAWCPRTPQSNLETLRNHAELEGVPNFTISQYDHRGLIVPAQTRDEYYPVFYVEPMQQNESILGLDQSSYALTQSAMLKAVQVNRPQSTIVMSLPQFENEPAASRNGIQVFAPIYQNGLPNETLEDREKNLAGFVVVALHIRRMLESVLKNINTPDLEMRIYAQGIRDKEKLIYTYNPQSAEKLISGWQTVSEVSVGGQTWKVICTSTDVFKKNNYRWEAPAVFVVGILLGFLLAIYIFSFERNRIREIMVALSLTDELTKLYNRRGFWLLSDEQVRLSLRNKKGFWLLVMDLDHLKKINDTLGHPEGDKAILRTAQLLQGTFRKSDIVARIGGDEFAVVVLEANPQALPGIMEHFQTQLKKNNNSPDFFYELAISVGAAYFDPSNPCTFEDLIADADKKLYAHKKTSHEKSNPHSIS